MAVWNTSKQLRLNHLVHFQLMLHKHREKQVTLHGSINEVMNTMIYCPAAACVKQSMYDEYRNMFIPVYRAVKNISSAKDNPLHLHRTLHPPIQFLCDIRFHLNGPSRGEKSGYALYVMLRGSAIEGSPK